MKIKNKLIILIVFLIGSGILVGIVSANPIDKTITMIYFQDSDQPVDDVVMLTRNCYGHYIDTWPKKYRINPDHNTTGPELVSHYSVNCSHGSCAMYDTDSIAIKSINFCDLEGTYKGDLFVMKNITIFPISDSDCSSVTGIGDGDNSQYYAISRNDNNNCRDQYFNNTECDQFLRYPSSGEISDKYIYMNKIKFVRTPEYDNCAIRIQKEREDCKRVHGKLINKTEISSHPEGIPYRYCELNLEIPSDNQTSADFESPIVSSFIPQSPVESLYCTIMNFFGARC